MTDEDTATAWLDQHAPINRTTGRFSYRRRVRFASGLDLSIQTDPQITFGAFCEIGLPDRDIPECSKHSVCRLTAVELLMLIKRESTPPTSSAEAPPHDRDKGS